MPSKIFYADDFPKTHFLSMPLFIIISNASVIIHVNSHVHKTIGRNRVLFSLGVFFIHIAYGRTYYTQGDSPSALTPIFPLIMNRKNIL